MKALITGVNGFVGNYLSKYLIEQGYTVYGTVIEDNITIKNVNITKVNLLNKEEVNEAIKSINPDYIYHLAGQSSVALSWKNSTLTMDVNINGTINLLEAVIKNNIDTKILLIGSSEQYGPVKENEGPINESHELKPQNPYAISKVAQEQIGVLYTRAYNMKIVMVRAFNHIGPGQKDDFVLSHFARKIAEIELGIESKLTVGNLEVYRDFTDVRDIVVGYHMLMKFGNVGEVYNIGSGNVYKLNDLLENLISKSNKDIIVKSDESKYRNVDIYLMQCDNNKIKNDLNWNVTIDIDTSLVDLLNYWRKCLRLGKRH